MSSIIQGFVHPIGGIDHALAMIGLGIIAGLIGGRALWLVPAAFVTFMAVGAMMGIRRIDLPNYETGIALSVVVIGVIIGFGRLLPIAGAAALAAVISVVHGYAHGAELPLETSVAGYVAGFVIATLLLHAIGIGLALGVERFGQPISLRARQVAGIGMAGIGIAILAGWL